jgi:Na+/H+-translocating membrane pyrophosphatase
MANAGGKWNNAKKIVEVDLRQKAHRSARCESRLAKLPSMLR